MIWLFVLAPLWVYAMGACVTARMLFIRWRPARVPLCGIERHYSGGCQPCYSAQLTCGRPHHMQKCYRRPKADLTTVHIDNDSHAAGWAVFAALAWPFVLAGLLVMRNPPALPEEKAKALKDMEREAGIGNG